MSPNFGDEFVLCLWAHAIKKSDPAALVVCDVFNPHFRFRMQGRFPRDVVFVDILWKCVWRAQSPAHLEGGTASFDPNEIDVDAWCQVNLDCLDDIVAGCDLQSIHFHGGGYINRIWINHALILAFAAILAEKWEVPLHITGFGLLPMDQNALQRLSPALLRADWIDLRDEGSFDHVRSVCPKSCIFSGDDALLMGIDAELASRQLSIRPERRLAIILQKDLFPAETINLLLGNPQVLIGTMDAYGLEGLDIVQCSPSDQIDLPIETSRVLTSNGKDITRTPVGTVMRNGLPVYPNGALISTRFHPHLVFTYFGLRGCALAGLDYYIEKHRSVTATLPNEWPLILAHELPNAIASEGVLRLGSGTLIDNPITQGAIARKRTTLRRLGLLQA